MDTLNYGRAELTGDSLMLRRFPDKTRKVWCTVWKLRACKPWGRC